MSSCPFESEASPGFRGTLPDCRAFELVSPVYGAGSVASGPKEQAPLISPDGEELLALSFGAFAGTEELEQSGFEYGAIYEFSRTATGWVPEAQDPPASLYPWREPQLNGVSPVDLGRSLWMVESAEHPGEETEDRAYETENNSSFVLREPQGNGKAQFPVVGPVTAPGHEKVRATHPSTIEGVSADLAHIVFSVRGEGKQLWPGDSTLEELQEQSPGDFVARFASLYEYHGASGGEPVLVGVRNVGRPPWRGGASHVNEGAELVSECGTAFDGISASGERVFFTAEAAEPCAGHEPPVNEVYARVNGAETVDISEPSSGAGGDCVDCKESGLKPAVFAGASEDGSKVFFTSEQELLPGAKGVSLFEYDFAAAHSDERVTLIASEVASVASVAKSGSEVYFEGAGVLTSVPNGNGEAAGEVSGRKLYAYNTETGETSFVAAGEGAASFDTTIDGQFLVFETATDLKGTRDTSHVPQLFEYDEANGSLVRVSVGQHAPAGYECQATGMIEEGYGCDGNTSIGEGAPRMVDTPGSSVAEDGTVVFSSELALTPGAVEGAARETENVYEYRGAQVYLVSPGDEAIRVPYEVHEVHTRLLGIDESGRDVFFSTADSLVPQDTDSQFSWYDAREDGGFSAPISTPGCAGEICQGALGQPPKLPAAEGTAVAVGGGNLPASPVVPAKPMTAAQLRAKKLAKALKACRTKRARPSRVACEKAARKKYVVNTNAKGKKKHG
jgi:hypothetical protein